MQDRSGRNVGDARLTYTQNGVLLKVDLRGVEPGIHAFHIHQTGRCDPPSFESANGHFSPGQNEHGFLDERGPHAGDQPNLHVPTSGHLSFEYVVGKVTLQSGQPGSLLDADGSALVMHAGADDYRTNPAGSAGDRLVCGVIMR
jgi:Cu-Zn family superoxide dismutase